VQIHSPKGRATNETNAVPTNVTMIAQRTAPKSKRGISNRTRVVARITKGISKRRLGTKYSSCLTNLPSFGTIYSRARRNGAVVREGWRVLLLWLPSLVHNRKGVPLNIKVLSSPVRWTDTEIDPKLTRAQDTTQPPTCTRTRSTAPCQWVYHSLSISLSSLALQKATTSVHGLDHDE
jgi:hypothetical protein